MIHAAEELGEVIGISAACRPLSVPQRERARRPGWSPLTWRTPCCGAPNAAVRWLRSSGPRYTGYGLLSGWD
jgi:hypothetical protein